LITEKKQMNNLIRIKKAQSLLEYSIYIAMAAAAFAAMFFFFRNYTAARMRSNIDTIGLGEQYEPR
jgi:hypothetical protein